jgi:MinD-like ATPase involved in chromosome partitioning or flagellar assembly
VASDDRPEHDPFAAPRRSSDTEDQAQRSVEEADEIEGRAARLMAQMAAQRQQRENPPPTPVAEIPVPSTVPEFESAPTQRIERIRPPIPADNDGVTSESDGPESTAPSDGRTPLPDEPRRPRPARRMTLPPWQTASPALPSVDDGGLDAPARSAKIPPAATDNPAPPDRPGQRDPGMMPPPVRPSGPPPPPPVWQGPPPPGWPPGLPPPPPGWTGPLPWMPPPGQRPPGYAPPLPLPPNQPARDDAAGASPTPTRAGRPQDGRRGRHSAQPADHAEPQASWTVPSLQDGVPNRNDGAAPHAGWRRAVHKATRGRVNPGVSRKDRERQQLLNQIRRPIVGNFRIAVLSIKGGVGKTTTTLGLGSALAMVRTDRVIAVDANPDRGTLAERALDASTSSTVRDLLRDPSIRRYADVRNHTRMTPSRLEVLASEQDPAVSEVFGDTDYRRTVDILQHYYNVVLTDCGTGIMHSAMSAVLDMANTIVLVSSPAIDGARSASATLDWLVEHGHRALARQAHVVFSASQPGRPTLKWEPVVEHFEARCGSTHVIPFEPHLADGAEFDFERLNLATARAYLGLAGAVSDDFSRLSSPSRIR